MEERGVGGGEEGGVIPYVLLPWPSFVIVHMFSASSTSSAS